MSMSIFFILFQPIWYLHVPFSWIYFRVKQKLWPISLFGFLSPLSHMHYNIYYWYLYWYTYMLVNQSIVYLRDVVFKSSLLLFCALLCLNMMYVWKCIVELKLGWNITTNAITVSRTNYDFKGGMVNNCPYHGAETTLFQICPCNCINIHSLSAANPDSIHAIRDVTRVSTDA